MKRQAQSIQKRRKIRRRPWVWGVVLGVVLACIASVAYYQVRGWFVQPEALFVLGGSPDREAFAAEFAHQHPDLPVWISSGTPEEYARWLFSKWNIEPERLHLDYQAVDTVTNFTSLVDDFEAQNYHSVYLVTSDYHMRRATVIGWIVLGSRGIEFQPLPVPSERSPEPWGKALRDGARSLVWIATGRTGASLGQRYRSQALEPSP